MKIKWEIKKKRGNWRPMLIVRCELEDWEEALNIDNAEIQTPFPCSSKNAYWNSSSRRKHMDDEQPQTWMAFYRISIGYAVIPLPWRPGSNPEYPEAPILLKALYRKHEAILKEAYDSVPFAISGILGMSTECKKHVAPWVAAEKMLRVVNE